MSSSKSSENTGDLFDRARERIVHKQVSSAVSHAPLPSVTKPDTGRDWTSPSAKFLDLKLQFARMQNIRGFGFWELDLESGNFNLLASALWREMGFSIDEVKSIETADQILVYVHEHDLYSLSYAVEQHIKKQEPLAFACRLKNADGSYRWVQLRGQSYRNSDGRATLLAGVIYDITNEKQAEQELSVNQQHLQRILRSSNDGIWEWNVKRRRLNFSQGCFRLLGYDADDHTLDWRRYRLWRSRVHPADIARFDAVFLRPEQLGRFDVEYRVRRKDDEWMWVRTRGDVIYGEQGEVEIVSGAIIDIDALKRAEDRILSAKSRAEQAYQAKSSFLSDMSHEIRTPLNAIIGFTRLFDHAENLSIEQQEYIYEIRRSGDRLLDLVNDVLELARIEAGRVTLELGILNVGDVFADLLAECAPIAEVNSVSLNFEPQHLGHVNLLADKGELQKSLQSLVAFCISNSRKHGRVIMSLTEATPEHLLVSVRDSSKGLPASLQNDLFEPFAGGETVDNSMRNGGLGLAICHRLIRHMNGDLKLLSGDFSGCHFQLKIPLATNVTEENVADVTGTHAVFPLVNQHLFADKTIVYIDNSADSINALTAYFSLFDGVVFEPAQETVLGLYKARSLRPDVIVIDLEMPGMDGHEMFSILQSDPTTAAIPVVALSNNDSPDVLRKSLDLGFSDYLLKPLDVEQLTMVISTLIAGTG